MSSCPTAKLNYNNRNREANKEIKPNNLTKRQKRWKMETMNSREHKNIMTIRLN